MQTPSLDEPRICRNCGEPLDRHFDDAGQAVGCPDDQVAVARIRERERERIFVLELADAVARHHHGERLADLPTQIASGIRRSVACAVRGTDPVHELRRDIAIRKAVSTTFGRLTELHTIGAVIDIYEHHLSGGTE